MAKYNAQILTDLKACAPIKLEATDDIFFEPNLHLTYPYKFAPFITFPTITTICNVKKQSKKKIKYLPRTYKHFGVFRTI